MGNNRTTTGRPRPSNPLKLVRRVMAVISILMVTLLFLDFTGLAARWFGWMAKIQFLPALLALNDSLACGSYSGIRTHLLFGDLPSRYHAGYIRVVRAEA